MGRPAAAREFCQRQHLPFICLSDANRASYRAYGLRRGSLREVVGPAALAAGLRAAARGHFASVPVDDVYQLGGTFLIDTGGVIRFARYPAHAGDHPSPAELDRAVAGVI
jgi:hypothetical protein